MSFFEDHPIFYETSDIGNKIDGRPSPRLPNRHKAIIESNLDIIRKKAVLDLGSHDGRWSIAAHVAGARFVFGIEGRRSLVDAARASAHQYNISDRSVTFRIADILENLPEGPSEHFRQVDTIFCLGLLYHIPCHYELFHAFEYIEPNHIILDTAVINNSKAFVNFTTESCDGKGRAMPDVAGKSSSIVGVPSVGYIKLIAEHFDFQVSEIDWHSLGITDWRHCEDYQWGDRRTYVLTANG